MTFLFAFSLREAPWKGPWLTRRLATWHSCHKFRCRSAAWRSRSARSGVRLKARTQEYEQLLDIKTRLEMEIDTYHRLLDGEGG